MSNIQNVYSLRELHDLLKNHPENNRIITFIDLDLTLVKPHPKNPDLDVLIEPEITKELFDFMKKHNIFFTFVTARFYDSACNEKKRNLKEMEYNLLTTIFPLLESIGIDIKPFKDESEEFHVIKNDKNRTVGLIYKGVVFGDKKGEIIKHYRRQYQLDESHPISIFIDDYEPYIKNVERHVPDAIILRRNIK